MPLSLDDIKIALSIVDSGDAREIVLRSGDVEIALRRGPPDPNEAAITPARAALQSAATAPTPAVSPRSGDDGLRAASSPTATSVPLRAPLSGVIYRAPSPDEPPFVSPGDDVTDDSVVCIIDVMKVMNLIKSPVAGRVSRIDVRNGELVAKGDVILWIDPH